MCRLRFYQSSYAADFTAEGEDAADFLQSQFSNQLQPFASGRCTYGLWLNAKGKVQADAWVLQTGEDSFRILSEHSDGVALRAHLERHIVADEVSIEAEPTKCYGLSLIGPTAADLLTQIGFIVPGEGQYTSKEQTILFCGRRSALPVYEIIFPQVDVFTAVKKQVEQAGAEAASTSWIEAQRIAIGIPRVPQEIGPEDLPGEAGLVGHEVRLDKGCFLGQEVVARMHNVGRPRRGLFRVSGQGKPPGVPAPINNEEGSAAGTLRTSFSVDSTWEGVALLKLHQAEKGATLSIKNNPLQILEPLRMR
ncbi:MAG: YgfZ/GcvT domain-containing protein [Coraliomargaritaceae bacterium]